MRAYPPGIMARKGDSIGPYLLESEIGQGPIATVWRATRSGQSAPRIVLKLFSDAGVIEALHALPVSKKGETDTRRTAGMLDCNFTHATPWMASEYFEKGSLRALLARGKMAPGQVHALALALAQALAQFHERGEAHLALKPENVMLVTDQTVRLVDGSIDRASDQARARACIAQGSTTVVYLAPEQRDSRFDVDQRADVFAFGAILIEMATAAVPLGNDETVALPAGLDPWVETIARKTFAKRKKRYASASELLRALQEIRPQQAEPNAKPEKPRPGKAQRGAPSTQGTSPSSATPVRIPFTRAEKVGIALLLIALVLMLVVNLTEGTWSFR